MSRNLFHFIIISLLICGLFACIKSNKVVLSETAKAHRFAFYNVENLFDTLDAPNKKDEEFMPNSEKQWNTVRYNEKMENIASVIKGMNFPTVIGLCEVENKAVLEDFVANPILDQEEYGIVHYESPDFRGIDVALLYKKSALKIVQSDYIRIPFPAAIVKDYTSRDILQVEATLEGRSCYFFVNHWPSRYGGQEESEPKRIHVAEYLRKAVDDVQRKQPNAAIFIMGDFNDSPTNKSVLETLAVSTSTKSANSTQLYNCSGAAHAAGVGSHNYRGEWNMLDQIIVSGVTLNGKSPFQAGTFKVYDSKEVMYFDKRNKMYRPNRSYGGSRYFGGYSDHLAIYLDVEVK